MRPIRYPTIALLLLAASMTPSTATPPKPNFANLPGYMRALNASTDPKARTILHEIDNGPRDLAHALAACKRIGIDVHGKETRPTVPPDQNAADIDRRIQVRLEQTHNLGLPSYAQPLSSRYAYTPDQLNQVRMALAQHQDILRLIHQSAEKPKLMPVMTSKDPAWQTALAFPVYARLREYARILNTESYMLAADGKPTAAIANQSLGFRIAEQAASNHRVIGLLVGYAAASITLSGMHNILYLDGRDAAVDNAVARAISTHHSQFSLRQAMIEDAAFAILLDDQVRLGGPDEIAEAMPTITAPPDSSRKPGKLTALERRFIVNLQDAQEAAHIRLLIRMIDVCESQPSPALRAKLSTVDTTDPTNALANESTWFAGLLKKADQITAFERVTEAAAKVLASKANTGRFPSQLPPGSFIDPFSHVPLRYRPEGHDGFVVYSVGPTGSFGGGIPTETKHVADELYFRYPARPVPVPIDSSQSI